MESTRVSIILPSYKDAPFLTDAIASVQAQTVSDWELLVVDDGLTDGASEKLALIAAADARIRVIKNEQNLGIQRSLNRALVEAQGEYIARIDDDDYWVDPKKLAKQLSFLQAHPNCLLLGTNAMIADENSMLLGTYILPETDAAIRKRILSKNCFLHPTIMFRAAAVKKVGGYPETDETKHIEDYALWLSLGKLGMFANLPDITTRLMVHSASLTAKNRIEQVRHMRLLIARYKNIYQGYIRARIILTIRLIGFSALSVIPIPRRLLYVIQNIYKRM